MPPAAAMRDRLAAIRTKLDAHRQSHILAFLESLAPDRQQSLLREVEALDLDELADLIERYVRHKPVAQLPREIEPASYYPHESRRRFDAEPFRRRGAELVRAGKVAAFTVAGGQGTRLGWNGPKGTYPATPVTGKPLFRLFAEQILAAGRRHGVVIPWYIMTSPINDGPTREFFRDNNHFGLGRRDVFFFPQGLLPSFELGTGRLMLDEQDALAMNPDGHGGSIKALRASGAVDDMNRRGVEHISYFQVDNPLVSIVDPLFIGLHAAAPDSSAEMSSKMVVKTDPAEKVGVFCRVSGKTTVVEYSDLPRELAEQRDGAGQLRFVAGSIAIHVLSVRFVEALTADTRHFALPYHRADKRVPYLDVISGRRIEPAAPNAVKLETFVFDALPLAKSSIVYETLREDEFAPIKNAEGPDSPATSHQLQSDRAGRWLERVGVVVPRDAQGHAAASIEISPLAALRPEDLDAAKLPREVRAGEDFVI